METDIPAASHANATTRAEERIIGVTYALAVVSGAAALIYQVTWVKMISLSFGSTTMAAGAVIGSFMAGMGLGARFYNVVFVRYRHAFKLYALLELGIAVATFLVTLTLYSLPQAYADAYHVIDNRYLLMSVRFASVFCLLLVPSALMGATFPALCTALIRTTSGLGRHLGMIYGLNTLGAAAGAVAAGFFLIESIGNQASTWVANAVNVGIALVATWLWSCVKETQLDEVPASEETALESRLPKSLVGAVLLGSGFATMAYEVFWIRALKYIVGNSTYAVSMVLVIFLVGLGFGGTLFRAVYRRRHPEMDLGACQLAIAVLALGAIGLEALLLTQDWFAANLSIFSRAVREAPWQTRITLAAFLSVVLLLPPTIAMGLSFPLASRLYVEDVKRLGRGVGTAYLLANIGSILGVATGAAVLLPLLGTAGATKLVAAINLFLGLVVLLYLGNWSVLRAMGALAVVGLCILLAASLPRHTAFRGDYESGDFRLLFVEEGDLGTTKVVEAAPGMTVMTIDGHAIGLDVGMDLLPYGLNSVVMFKQQILAHFPMLLVPDARRTLNIGLGSGETLASLAGYPGIELLDCVEIVPGVVRGAEFFDDFAGLEDPRVQVHVDDAVHYLLTTDTTYDVIIADGKQNPEFSGNAAVLSQEFHRYCLDRLSERGVLIEWLSPALHPHAFRVAVRSFCEVFPEVGAYYFIPACVALVGSKQPVGADPATWPLGFPADRARQELKVFSMDHPMSLLAARVAEGDALRTLLDGIEANTWDHPVLEFIAYKEFNIKQDLRYVYENVKLLHDAGPVDSDAPFVPPGTPGRYITSNRLLRRGYLEFLNTADSEALRPLCLKALQENPDDSLAKSLLRRIAQGYDALRESADRR